MFQRIITGAALAFISVAFVLLGEWYSLRHSDLQDFDFYLWVGRTDLVYRIAGKLAGN